jgi:apolipoprotein D and lipocalin family protein
LLWIFARTPKLDARTYSMLLDKARTLGFPVDQVRKVPQFPDQVGRQGFQ